MYPIKPNGIEGNWRWSKEKYVKGKEEELLEWVNRDRKWSVYVKQFLKSNPTKPPETIWLNSDVGHNHEAKEEAKTFNKKEVFGTPKPERLIERILHLGSNENDLVLDSFLGSATTAAVAHKMNRKYIGIELGDHAYSHCFPRMKKVVDGEQGGISKSVKWQGGGGFKFYTLAPSLLQKDKYDNWVIDKNYNADMLAAAMAKHEGFTFHPEATQYWKQGKSTEQDYIYTTTQFLTIDSLEHIQAEMQPEESLLICCKAFQKECANRFPKIFIKKIPQMLLGRCEFGKEDYSLNIVNMPEGTLPESDLTGVDDPEWEAATDPYTMKKENDKKAGNQQGTLF